MLCSSRTRRAFARFAGFGVLMIASSLASAQSTNSAIQDLQFGYRIAGGGSGPLSLTPAFNSETLAYEAVAPVDTAIVDGAIYPAEPGQVVTVNGEATFDTGLGEIYSETAISSLPAQLAIEVTAPDGITTRTYTVQLVRPASTNSRLSMLTVSAGTLLPDFDPAYGSYRVVVPKEAATIRFTPTHSDPAGTITLDGATVTSGVETAPQSLQVLPATNSFEIESTAPDGLSSMRYAISVERQIGTNARLASLGVSPAAFVFDPELDYQAATVTSEVTSLALTPATEDPDATLSLQLNYGEITPIANGTATNVDLPFGDTVIDLRATSEDANITRWYRYVITRTIDPRVAIQQVTSSASYCCGPQPTSPNQLSFGFQALSTQRSVAVEVRTIDPNATLRFAGQPLAQGISATVDLSTPNTPTSPLQIPLEVTSADGMVQLTYTVELVRQISTVAHLQGLSSPQGTLSPTFNAQTYHYHVALPTGTQFQVVANPLDPAATMRWQGEPLLAGEPSSPVTITLGGAAYAIEVTAESGSAILYWVNVTAIPSDINTLDALAVSTGELTPTFSPETTEYTLSLPSETTRLRASARRSHPGAVFLVNGVSLDDDELSAEIDVTAPGAIIPVVVRSESSIERTYRINIDRPNGVPTITAPDGQTTLEDTPVVISLTVGDIETPASNLTLSVRSANQAILPDALLAAGLSGTGAQRTLSFTPPQDVNGHAMLTFEVADDRGGVGTHNLLFSVHPVNDAPAFNLEVAQLRIDVSNGPVRVRNVLTGARPGPANEAGQTMIAFTASVTAPGAQHPATSILLDPVGGGVYDLLVTPLGNPGSQAGSALYTVSMQDNGGTEFGGIDESEAGPFRLDVVETPGVDLALSISPVEVGGSRWRYDLLVTNHGSAPVVGATVELWTVRGLSGISFVCASPMAGQGCETGTSAQGFRTSTLSLEVGASALLRIEGELQGLANFVELGAQVSSAPGVSLVETQDDRVYRVDAVAPQGISANGFE